MNKALRFIGVFLCAAFLLIGCQRSRYTLAIHVEGEGTVEPPSGMRYRRNQIVTVRPWAAEGYRFKEWKGKNRDDVVEDKEDNPGTWKIVMDGDKSITAVFISTDNPVPSPSGSLATPVTSPEKTPPGATATITAASETPPPELPTPTPVIDSPAPVSPSSTPVMDIPTPAPDDETPPPDDETPTPVIVATPSPEYSPTPVYTGGSPRPTPTPASTPVYVLTVTNDGRGTTVPNGSLNVYRYTWTSITAKPAAGRKFKHWKVVSGKGVRFDNRHSASTKVRLTKGNATIRACFK